MALSTLNVTVTAQIAVTSKRTVEGVDLQGNKTHKYEKILTIGTSADQADQFVIRESLAIGAGAVSILDLHTSLTNVFGEAANFAKIKAVLVQNKSANAGTVIKVGGNTGAQAIALFDDPTDQAPVRVGGAFLMSSADATGLCAVSNGVADQLEIENADGVNGALVDLVIVGTTA